LRKNILIFRNGKSVVNLSPSHPDRGALANVINVGRAAVDAEGAQRECLMRAVRVVLIPDVGVKPVEVTLSVAVRKSPLTGEHAVVTIARGVPGYSGVT
jgi:hypothetical protein